MVIIVIIILNYYYDDHNNDDDHRLLVYIFLMRPIINKNTFLVIMVINEMKVQKKPIKVNVYFR